MKRLSTQLNFLNMTIFFFFINTRQNLSFGLKFAKDTRKLKMFKSDAVDII